MWMNKILSNTILLKGDEAGTSEFEPYSLNGGFMMWRGKVECFNEILKIIKNYDIWTLKD